MALTPEQILARLKSELKKYGLNYEDLSDADIPRRSITRPGEPRLLGFSREPREVARVTSVSGKKLEIMVFEKEERDNIANIVEEISERLGINYMVLKGY